MVYISGLFAVSCTIHLTMRPLPGPLLLLCEAGRTPDSHALHSHALHPMPNTMLSTITILDTLPSMLSCMAGHCTHEP